MVRKRIARTPLAVTKKASVSDLKVFIDWEVKTEGNPILVLYLANIHDGESILNELNVFLRHQRAKRGVANNILRYLKYLSALGGVVSAQSLKDYKDFLDKDKGSEANSKSEVFGACKKFAKHLISVGIIPNQSLPENFKRTTVKPKSSFSEIAIANPKEFDKYIFKHRHSINKLAGEFNLEEVESEILFYNISAMEFIHEKSKAELKAALSDMVFVDRLVGKLSSEDIERLKKLDWAVCSNEDRSIELALGILYAQFGRVISKTGDYSQIHDWLKSRGWFGSRIQSAFIANRYIQRPLFLACLSHPDLLPNVDTVFRYLYVDCLQKSFESGYTNVFMGKKRGQSIDVDLRNSDDLVQLLKSYIKHFSKGMRLDFSSPYFKEDKVSIFGRINFDRLGKEKTLVFEGYDPSTPASWVRTKLKDYAKENDLLELISHSNFSATGENFRPTHAIIRKLSGESLGRIKAALGHVYTSTTKGYVKRAETSALIDRKARNFQLFIVEQALNVHSAPNHDECNEDDSRDVPERVELISSHLEQLEVNRIVLTDINLISEWIAFSNLIIKEKDRLILSNPSRWANHWEVILAEYQEFLSQVSTKDFKRAEEFAVTIELPIID